jgi:hypothetical protein
MNSGNLDAMLECQGCHRHVRATESSCPFCGADVLLTSAPGTGSFPLVAFAAGLSLLGCSEPDDEAGDSNATTTESSTDTSTSETSSTTGDGDGDTQTTLEDDGTAYGGPMPCSELDNAIPIAVGSNPIDTSMSGNEFDTSCGDQQGAGPDELLLFQAPAAGTFNFALTGATFDAWLLRSGYYCGAYGVSECVPNQALDIAVVEGEDLYLIIDGPTDGGAVSVDVTQG